MLLKIETVLQEIFAAAGILVVAVIFILLLATMLGGLFVTPKDAVSVLQAQGYSNIKIVDHTILLVWLQGCPSPADNVKYVFQATDKDENSVVDRLCLSVPFQYNPH